MDTLTHALSGALLARATAPNPAKAAIPTGRRVAVGFLAAAFPDIDFVLGYVSPIVYLTGHRGITHSVLLWPLWALALAWIFSKLYGARASWKAYVGVCAMSIGIHILGDVITSFGTMVWAPLSDARVGWNTTFIIDLWFTGIILAGLLASLAFRRSRIPAQAGLAVLAGYVGFQAILHQQAVDFGERFAQAQGMSSARVTAVPRPVSPFNWMVVVDDGERYFHASVNLRRDAPLPPPGPDAGLLARLDAAYQPLASANWTEDSRFGPPTARAVVMEAWQQPALAFFRWFAAYPLLYRVETGNPSLCVWFQDLRFFTPGRGTWPFRFGVCREAGGPWQPFQLLGDGARAPLY
ncbi:MAG TPA: metal-dependent hydrolase [Pelomicrobium sp.]|nr:metal-dependent hydrolase [Pelomicrobium sp.]